mgnify:CR=1 FL=1
MKNIMAKATIEQDFPSGLAIYDLKEFLSILRLVDKPELSIGDEMVTVSGSSGRARIKYFFADENIITTPQKDVKMPESEVQFTLSIEDLDSIRAASSSYGHEYFTVKKVGEQITLTVEDIEKYTEKNANNTGNDFSIDVPGTAESDDFVFIIAVNTVKIIRGDYEVSLSSKRIAEFDNKDHDLKYWIALHKSSVYNA